MKKINPIYVSVLIALLILAACATPKYAEQVSVIDYSKYSAECFLTESNSVSFEYQPIGSISVISYSGDSQTIQTKVQSYDTLYGDSLVVKKKQNIYATPDRALSRAIKEAKAMGANGIINLRINNRYIDGRQCIELSGMAIKR